MEVKASLTIIKAAALISRSRIAYNSFLLIRIEVKPSLDSLLISIYPNSGYGTPIINAKVL